MEFKERSRVDVYSNMLTLQADMGFPFERPFFERSEWLKAEIVFDFGCGNGHYLNLLCDLFPYKKYIGCEVDPEMREVAKHNCNAKPNVTIISPEEIINYSNVDFFIFRLVLLHLPDRKVAYKLAGEIGREDCYILAIDADDEFFTIRPNPEVFLKTLVSFRKKSVERNLIDKIDDELLPFKYSLVFFHRVIINNSFQHVKDLMAKYMYFTAELGIGNPLSEDLKTDLLEWWLNPSSYVQYGIFGKIFKKSSLL